MSLSLDLNCFRQKEKESVTQIKRGKSTQIHFSRSRGCVIHVTLLQTLTTTRFLIDNDHRQNRVGLLIVSQLFDQFIIVFLPTRKVKLNPF